MTAPHTFTLTLDLGPGSWITANDRMHWARKAKITARIRAASAGLALAAGLPRRLGHVHVTVHVHGRTNGRMDPANAYPTVKAAIDGLTDYGVWPDDDDKHLDGPDMRRGAPATDLPKGWHRLTFTIIEGADQ